LKNICNLFKLRLNMAIKSALLVIPTVSVVSFLGIMYYVRPSQISGSFLISAIFCFIISAYISMRLQARENDIHEEILLLHCKKSSEYYISRELLIYSLSCLYSAVVIIYPLIRYIMNNNIFTRPLKANDIICGSLIIFGSGFCGTAIGDLFHHRIITTNRNSVIGLILVSILAICKQPLIQTFSFLKILNIILPPITDGLVMVGDSDIFNTIGILKIFIHMITFVIAIILIKIIILSRKKFTV